jgi:hypothetical protein
MNIPRSINFYARILLVWISTLTSGGATDEKGAAPIMIEMRSQNSGWRLLVYADGSGSLGYGSIAGDVAVFPKGAVDFKSLVDSARQKEVVKLRKPEGDQVLDPENVAVSIRTARGSSSEKSELKAMGAEWVAVCRKILPQLEAENPERFQQLLKDQPFLRKKPERYPKKEAEPAPSPGK